MKEFTKIDDTYQLYEKRYELTKIARECGIADEQFNSLNSRDKFLTLSNRLKESGRVHLASFFYGKLFELSTSIDALLSKVECLIELGEFDEANRFNNIGFELYLEDPEVDPQRVEEQLYFQKAQIAFATEKYHIAEWLSEESIIKYSGAKFYYLLCAIFISLSRTTDARKFYNKYSAKFSNSLDFLIEVFILLLNVNQIDKALEFIGTFNNINSEKKRIIINYVNSYYSSNKNKKVLKSFFMNEVNISAGITGC